MEQIRGRVSERYYIIKNEIRNWNFEKLTGIGKKRGHDKYAILEINVFRFIDYPDKDKIKENYKSIRFNESYVIWKLSDLQFPKDMYEYGKDELIQSAEAVIDLFSIIKEQRLDLVFEIVWAGYGVTDRWGMGAVNSAFVNAILSCFDDKLLQQGLESKKEHPLINGEYQNNYS
jgi:hypothetical protein